MGVARVVCAAFLFSGAAAASAGCGYSVGYRTAEGVETIAVPIFDNETFPLRRELEYELTSAFRKEIQVRTPLVLTERSDADLVVYGRIKGFREGVVTEDRLDRKTESNLYVVVDLVVEDHRNSLRSEFRVERSEPFSINRGETFETARTRAIANLAERLVTQIEDWGPLRDGDGPSGSDNVPLE